ncbi:hypothetical protein OPQ81_011552 [Rhizoctonia solani]|nr:hypothetical protein OPQ81_011552 [Rhizoctonia solani]
MKQMRSNLPVRGVVGRFEDEGRQVLKEQLGKSRWVIADGGKHLGYYSAKIDSRGVGREGLHNMMPYLYEYLFQWTFCARRAF